MEKELFHEVENDLLILRCYFLPEEQDENYSHEVESQAKNSGEKTSVFTNCRQACIALCVNVIDTMAE